MSHLFVFFFNDTATTEIYTLSLHDALPIFPPHLLPLGGLKLQGAGVDLRLLPRALDPQAVQLLEHVVGQLEGLDRKSTRLNSSHANISYAVFCLKKKKIKYMPIYFYL